MEEYRVKSFSICCDTTEHSLVAAFFFFFFPFLFPPVAQFLAPSRTAMPTLLSPQLLDYRCPYFSIIIYSAGMGWGTWLHYRYLFIHGSTSTRPLNAGTFWLFFSFSEMEEVHHLYHQDSGRLGKNNLMSSSMASMASLAAAAGTTAPPAPSSAPSPHQPSHLCAGCGHPIKDRYLLQVAALRNRLPFFL